MYASIDSLVDKLDLGLRLSESNSVCNTNAPAWPMPQPLTAKIEAEPYPIDALPDTILAAVEEVGGFVKAPVPLVASSAIAALSLAIQAHYDVERAINLHGPVSTSNASQNIAYKFLNHALPMV